MTNEPSTPHPSKAVSDFGERSEQELRQFFRDLAQRVRYAEFDHVKIEAFQRFVNLGVLDLWSEVDDEVKAKRLGVEPESLEATRDVPEYKEVVAALEREFAVLKKPRSLQEHIKDPLLQDALAKRTERIALHAKNPRDSARPLEILADRAMPPPPRTIEGGKTLIFDEGAMRLLLEAQKEARELPPIEVEAEVVEGSE